MAAQGSPLKRRLLLPLAFALPLSFSARAQSVWPSQPIRLVVPFQPGTAPDLLARRLSDNLGTRFGQPMPIENRSGAGGTIGTDAIAKARPDGYTLGISSAAAHAVARGVYPNLSYDPIRDFSHIALLAELPLGLGVAADGPFRDLAGFIAAARAQPGRLRIGSPGNGTTAHVAIELLQRATGANFIHVPYRSGPQAVPEIIAGRIEASLSILSDVAGNERVRVLAVAASQRLERWPATATFREQGIDLLATLWFGLCAPAGLPPMIADQLHAAAEIAVARPEFAALLVPLGSVPHRAMARGEVTGFVAAEGQRWEGATRANGIRAD